MKKITVITLITLILALIIPLSVSAGSEPVRHVVDDADVLTAEEENALQQKLEKLSSRLKCHIVVVAINDLGYLSSYSYADSYYHNNGYGYGKDKSGVLLLISLESGASVGNREYYIYTYGEAEDKLGDSELTDIEDAMLPHLRENDYYEGFVAFADVVKEELAFDMLTNLIIAVVIGAVAAFIILTGMKNQLKSVRPQRNATNYVRQGSFLLTKDLDLYLYRNVTRTRRQSNNYSSRGGGGGSRGGGRGGNF